MKKIAVVAGARPNFMKIACLCPLLTTHFETCVVHSGQHVDPAMSDNFLAEFGITVDRYLKAGSALGDIYEKAREFFRQYAPDAVITVGDVTTTLACAIAAKYERIPVVHVEAGLRSGDLSMPEEINRMAADSISDVLFATDEHGYGTGVKLPHEHRTYLSGNTMLDLIVARKDRFVKIKGDYALATIHRKENIESKTRLERVLEILHDVATFIELILPLHPHTRKMIEGHGLSSFISGNNRIKITEPMGYADFISHVKSSKLVLTDSGGIQTEANFLGVPCITLRSTTEHKNTLLGTNRLTGLKMNFVRHAVVDAIHLPGAYSSYRTPVDDGKASHRIFEILKGIL